jgi:tRNA (cmo5U34)-methyltransferase
VRGGYDSGVGDSIIAGNASWSFSGDVPLNFDEHMRKSVPLYRESHDLIAGISDFFLYDGAVAYELGCSTGALTQKLAERVQGKSVKIFGIDRESGMVEAARARCQSYPSVKVIHADIVEYDFDEADLFVSYLTMQFVRPRFRQDTINRIYRSLRWGGAFVYFEKVRAPDARFNDYISLFYTDYKIDQGYAGDEIVGKARSLKGVLEPFSTQGNLDLLKRAGFVDVMTVFKYMCFEGFLAIK